MTDLLTPTSRRATPAAGPQRPLALSAALAGVASSGLMLLVCMVFGLAGWFASDAGGHGSTLDALRVGADAWLLAHGSSLALAGVTISVVPLGLSSACAYLAFRSGRWAGSTSGVDDDRTVLLGSLVLAGSYGVVATVVAVLASLEQARTDPGLAFVGGFTISLLAGGLGILSGSGRAASVRARMPVNLLAIGTGVIGGVLMMLAAGCAVLVVSLLTGFGEAANVLTALDTDVPGSLLYTLVVAAVAPNAALFAGAYLVGPGFMVGTGTLVSPTAVALGPLPAFPLVAALPADGPTPGWVLFLTGTPVLLGAAAAVLSLRRYPLLRYDLGALRGAVVGALSGVAFGAVTTLAGGSVGPGRMGEVGTFGPATMLNAGVGMAIGGLVAGVVATWWLRRSAGR